MTNEEQLLRWFVHGRTGVSSRAMAAVAAGLDPDARWGSNYPHDPDDFNRCLLLLRDAPCVRDAFPEIAKLSPQWAALIEHWDEIEGEFLAEVGLNWEKGRSLHATKTYYLMDRLISNAARPQEAAGSGGE